MPDVEVGDYNIKARLRNECQCFWNGSHGGNGALPRRAELAAKARTKFGDEPAIDARNAAGFGGGVWLRLCCASCIYIAMLVQARNSWIVEPASTF